MSKTLVAFFSASGNTKRVAEKLAAAIDSDLYEIKPAVPYTSADLNWRDRHSRSSVEMNDPSSRPELADYHANIAGYDRIFLGFPIWWYTAPTIVRSFLESYVSPKDHYFVCHLWWQRAGQDCERAGIQLPGAAIEDGRLFNGNSAEAALKQWAESF